MAGAAGAGWPGPPLTARPRPRHLVMLPSASSRHRRGGRRPRGIAPSARASVRRSFSRPPRRSRRRSPRTTMPGTSWTRDQDGDAGQSPSW